MHGTHHDSATQCCLCDMGLGHLNFIRQTITLHAIKHLPQQSGNSMQFSPPLIEAVLVRRYKRFLADVELADGSIITVHCPNPGSMAGLTEPGNRTWISDSQNPKRKLRYTWELTEIAGFEGKVMVGVNTNQPNKLAEEAILAGIIPGLAGYNTLRREVKYGKNSRIDILLEEADRPKCYVEVKNVHFVRTPDLHEFPDSVTARGAKHLDELGDMVDEGHRAVMLYIIQRQDGSRFKLATDIDTVYANAYKRAMERGVEAFALRCNMSPTAIEPLDLLPID